MPHTPMTSILHNGNWQWKADEFLARRGIRPGEHAGGARLSVPNYHVRFDPLPVITSASLASPSLNPAGAKTGSGEPASGDLHAVVKTATELARISGVAIHNNLDKGGAFWVLTSDTTSVLGRQLANLGMRFLPSKGYWTK